MEIRDRPGMVTVELALGMSSLMLVLTAALFGVMATGSQQSLCFQVGSAARAFSIGQELPSGAANTAFHIEDQGEFFTLVGRRHGIQLGQWTVGQLSCEVSGVRQQDSLRW